MTDKKVQETKKALLVNKIDNVGELRRVLSKIPDNCSLSVIGVTGGLCYNKEINNLTLDESSYIENLFDENEKDLRR